MSERSGRGVAAGALGIALLIALGVWAAVLISSVRRDPGLDGWLTGLFGGGFVALLVAAGGAWLAIFNATRKPEPKGGPELYQATAGDLDQVLAELEDVRRRTKAEINGLAAKRIPLCVAGAVLLWVASQFTDDPADVMDLLIFSGIAAFLGYFWSAWKLAEAYRKLYKERVLPKIAADFGALSWRPAQPPLAEFKQHRLFPDWDDCSAEDEIHGDYRGLPLSIIELKLTLGSGDNEKTVFDGLTCAVTLPRGLSGTTIVVPDRGVFGNFAKRLQGGPCRQVKLEDPEFERAYEVYASDQIAARALLTPAFMERFRAMAQTGRFGAPVALVQDNRLLLAMAKSSSRDLFEPPSYRQPAAGREAVVQLHDDIEAVLKAADAVIDLDQAARLQPL